MAIFKNWKSRTSKNTTPEAPVMQETPVASKPEPENKNDGNDGVVVINVMGYGNENWVHPNVSPKFPTPRINRTEAVTFDSMPLKNCAVPAGWWFSEYSDDQEMVFRFPEVTRELLALAYNEPATDIQCVTFSYDRTMGMIFASAWGYDRRRGNAVWQTVVKFDVVQTFHPYIMLIGGVTPAMDTRLCSSGFISNLLHGSPLRVRAAYNITCEIAEQTYDILIDYVAAIISVAAKGLFKHDLQIKADRQYTSVETSVETLEDIISEAKVLAAHVSTKSFYGIHGNSADWEKAQTLYDKFIRTANNFDVTSVIYSQLRYACRACELSIDMSKLDMIGKLLGTCQTELLGVFDLLRN